MESAKKMCESWALKLPTFDLLQVDFQIKADLEIIKFFYLKLGKLMSLKFQKSDNEYVIYTAYGTLTRIINLTFEKILFLSTICRWCLISFSAVPVFRKIETVERIVVTYSTIIYSHKKYLTHLKNYALF